MCNCSLTNLGNFIRDADEGLQQTVGEGDYKALINVMGYLLQVKERQAVTDEMFGPLRDTIGLLKYYDQDIPEQVNVLLQVRLYFKKLKHYHLYFHKM